MLAVSCALFIALLSSAPEAHPEVIYEPYVDSALHDTKETYPVPKALVFAIMQQESAFDAKALSKAGARGLMQVMPYTSSKVGMPEADLFDPKTNILAGVRLLAALLRYYGGDVLSTLIAYNSRPRELYAPVPRNNETPIYCLRVLAFFQKYLLRYPPASTDDSVRSRNHQ